LRVDPLRQFGEDSRHLVEAADAALIAAKIERRRLT
jgi:hypothetical protein